MFKISLFSSTATNLTWYPQNQNGEKGEAEKIHGLSMEHPHDNQGLWETIEKLAKRKTTKNYSRVD